MISVKILTYNQEKYISQAIESILMQKCDEPFEILIGDDCSTDRTGMIVDDYQSRYPDIIRVFRPEHNLGSAANSIRVLQFAKGDYTSICDGDDYWLRDDVLQKQVDTFRSMPDVGMVCAKAKCYNQDKGTFDGTLGYPGAEDLMTMIRDNRDVAAPTLAFRTSLLRQCVAENEWYVKNRCFYDTIEAYWFAYNSRIKFMDEEWSAYRVLNSSASHTKSPEKEAEYERRYFAVKWHFLLTHPDLCNAELFEILMKDYDTRSMGMAYMADCKVRATKAYRLGNIVMNPLRKLKTK